MHTVVADAAQAHKAHQGTLGGAHATAAGSGGRSRCGCGASQPGRHGKDEGCGCVHRSQGQPRAYKIPTTTPLPGPVYYCCLRHQVHHPCQPSDPSTATNTDAWPPPPHRAASTLAPLLPSPAQHNQVHLLPLGPGDYRLCHACGRQRRSAAGAISGRSRCSRLTALPVVAAKMQVPWCLLEAHNSLTCQHQSAPATLAHRPQASQAVAPTCRPPPPHLRRRQLLAAGAHVSRRHHVAAPKTGTGYGVYYSCTHASASMSGLVMALREGAAEEPHQRSRAGMHPPAARGHALHAYCRLCELANRCPAPPHPTHSLCGTPQQLQACSSGTGGLTKAEAQG